MAREHTTNDSAKDVEGSDRYEIPMRLLSNGALSLVMVQTAPLSSEQLREGGDRPAALAAVHALFDHDDASGAESELDSLAPPDPLLIVFPEFSFGFNHWHDLDERIRKRPEKIIVIAGFGPVKGKAIREWTEDPRVETERLGPNETLRSGRSYNGGWCWVHDPSDTGRTQCFCFLKNCREQSVEPQHVTEEGRSVLALRFDDMLLLPAICADLVSNREGNPQERFREIARSEADEPRVLVVGSLYDPSPWNSIWNARLNYLVQSIPNVVVALVNCAFDVPRSQDEEDCWRTRTGVYMDRRYRASLPSESERRPFIRTQETDALVGGVVRHSQPSILFGRVVWPPYGPTTARWLWEVSHRLDLVTMVSEDITECPSLLDYEFPRFLRRHMQPGTSQQEAAVREISDGVGISSESITGTCLHGLGAKASPPTEPWGFDNQPTDPKELLKRSTKALCQLAGSDQTVWCVDPSLEGLLSCTETGANILIWSGEKGKVMRQQLRSWAACTDSHPPLIAVAHADDGGLYPELVRPDRHTDFAAPPEESDDIGQAHGTRFAKFIPIAEVLDDEQDDDQRFDALREDVPL